MKRGSLDNSLSEPKLKSRRSQEQEVYYYNEMSRLYEEESRFFKRGEAQPQSLRRESKAGVSLRDAAADELFDRISTSPST